MISCQLEASYRIWHARAEGLDAVAVPLSEAPAGERAPVVRDDEDLLVLAEDDVEQGVDVVRQLLPGVLSRVGRLVLFRWRTVTA